ncbi:MAG: hypothetical protein ACRD4J_11205, partial [Nitrososphaeraceae archaeon]
TRCYYCDSKDSGSVDGYERHVVTRHPNLPGFMLYETKVLRLSSASTFLAYYIYYSFRMDSHCSIS